MTGKRLDGVIERAARNDSRSDTGVASSTWHKLCTVEIAKHLRGRTTCQRFNADEAISTVVVVVVTAINHRERAPFGVSGRMALHALAGCMRRAAIVTTPPFPRGAAATARGTDDQGSFVRHSARREVSRFAAGRAETSRSTSMAWAP